MPPRTVHLVDASPYVFRAFFALPDSIVDAAGRPANAVYGFAGFLLRYLDELEPTHIAVAFDESLTTSFRNELFPDYKAQRELPPPELEAQLRCCRRFAEALGATTFADERYEADDFIGTLARPLRRRGHAVRVVTSDKDLAQLVDEGTVLHDFAKDEVLGPAEVREKFGVRPEQIPDYLGLAGDAVDNIPGVRGVGKKTAVALLERFEDLDALFADLEAVASLPLRGARSLAARLEAARDDAFLSRELATIATDAPAEAKLGALALRRPDAAELDALRAELGFETIFERAGRRRPARG